MLSMSLYISDCAFVAEGGWSTAVISYSSEEAAHVEGYCPVCSVTRCVRTLALILANGRGMSPFAPAACWAEDMGGDFAIVRS